MKKRILAIVLGLSVAVSVAGCGGKLSDGVIEIEEYKGLEVEKVEAQVVTEQDVESEIKSTIETMEKMTVVKNRAVEKGDIITLDYSGKVDGEVFEGGTAQDQRLEIGSGAFIPGFEDAIIGHKLGETFDIDVTFPESYGQEDLAGKAAVFTITIDKITAFPELTDKLVAQLDSEVKTVADYKAKVKAALEVENQKTADSSLEQNVWAALIKNCTIEDYPEEQYKEKTTQLNNQYNYVAQMYGMTVDQLLQAYYKVTLDEMAKELIKQELAVELIAKEEKIVVSDKVYTEKLEGYATEYGYTTPDEMEENVGKDVLKKMMLQEMVGEYLVENCELVEKKTEK